MSRYFGFLQPWICTIFTFGTAVPRFTKNLLFCPLLDDIRRWNTETTGHKDATVVFVSLELLLLCSNPLSYNCCNLKWLEDQPEARVALKLRTCFTCKLAMEKFLFLNLKFCNKKIKTVTKKYEGNFWFKDLDNEVTIISQLYHRSRSRWKRHQILVHYKNYRMMIYRPIFVH